MYISVANIPLSNAIKAHSNLPKWARRFMKIEELNAITIKRNVWVVSKGFFCIYVAATRAVREPFEGECAATATVQL